MPLDPEGSKIRRANNRQSSAELLTEEGVPFTVHNDGAHLVLKPSDRNREVNHIDFWPGTGLWIWRMRDGVRERKRGRGVHKLINLYKVISCEPNETTLQTTPSANQRNETLFTPQQLNDINAKLLIAAKDDRKSRKS